ncbi:MAG: hypothetical protein FWB98_08965, partial [Defluviitaleaceae bacterium]|nr:hypothetical protein [Defluviitaleaceae bacterium]
MLDLTSKQRDEIGLTFVLRHLQPVTPYGAEKTKSLVPLTKEEAEICFDNMEVGWGISSDALPRFKNIRGCVEKAKTLPLNEVELFEVKGFLLTLEKLLAEDLPDLKGITFLPMTDALDILDPQNNRLSPFSLESPKLAELRREKERLEKLGDTEKRALVVAEEDAEEMRVMEVLTNALRAYIPVFVHNTEAIGDLDLTIAKARLAQQFGGVRPAISNTVNITDMTNPYFADVLAQKGKQFTKVSISMPRGVTIITGANMGGKSMAIKTIALNIALCQLGFFVFGETAEIPMFDAIHLITDDAQSATEGLSTFGAEMTHLNTAVKAIRNGFTFLAMDEPVCGTNPAEATIIAQGITSFLAEQSAISLLSTHYDRITPLATAHYRVAGITETGAMDYTLHPAGINEP